MADECDDVMSGKKSISIDLRKFRDSFYTRKKSRLEQVCTEDCKRKFEDNLSAKM